MKLKDTHTDQTPLGKAISPMQGYHQAMIRWKHLCETLIFACPYSTSEFLAALDATGGHYDRERAKARCRDLAAALQDTYPEESSPLRRCHMAVANTLFLDRYAHLLPKPPRRPGMRPQQDHATEAERMERAEALAAAL